MAEKEIHLELLLGRRVLSASGKSVGRLEEIIVEQVKGEYIVQEYLIGTFALFERLSAWSIGRAVLKLFGLTKKGGYRVTWDKLDLSDAEKPRLLCSVQELEKLSAE